MGKGRARRGKDDPEGGDESSIEANSSAHESDGSAKSIESATPPDTHKNHTIAKRITIPIRQAAAAKRTKWTECVAAAHIVQDETRSHWHESGSDMDPNCLAEWTGRITKTLVQQNTRVLANLDAVSAAKTAKAQVDTIRTKVSKLKNHVRNGENQHRQLREEFEMRRHFNDEAHAATRFLKHVDRVKNNNL